MATPTEFSFTIQDDAGVKAPCLVYASYNGAVETVDGLIGEWLALGALIDDVAAGVILNGHVKIPLDGFKTNVTWKQTAEADSPVSDVLNLVFTNDDTIWTDTVSIPSTLAALVTGGVPDLTNGQPIDLLADAIAGSFTNGYFVNRTGSDLIALQKAFRSTRKHRKQLRLRSERRP